MVVERSLRSCVLCGTEFEGRSFLCSSCSQRYRQERPSTDVRRRFYEGVDRLYPHWANTYGAYNPPYALLNWLGRQQRSLRILELGCGGGALLRDLALQGFDRLVGLDLARTAVEEARRQRTTSWLVVGDAERLPFRTGAFDAVVAVDLIEHLENVECHVAEVARVLCVDGQYLVKTPNRLLAELYYRVAGLHDYRFWHPSLLSPRELRALLVRHGFEVRFLAQPQLTPAQVRKIPSAILRAIARRVPISVLPTFLRPHLEVVAVLRRRYMRGVNCGTLMISLRSEGDW